MGPNYSPGPYHPDEREARQLLEEPARLYAELTSAQQEVEKIPESARVLNINTGPEFKGVAQRDLERIWYEHITRALENDETVVAQMAGMQLIIRPGDVDPDPPAVGQYISDAWHQKYEERQQALKERPPFPSLKMP